MRAAELVKEAARIEAHKAKADANAAKEAASARADEAEAAATERALKAEQDADAALADAQEQLDRAILEATDSGRGLHLDEERTCVVCYDDFLGFSDGVECDCADAHFVCNECFVASVRSSITDTPAKQALRDGHIYCPYATFPPTQHSCKSGPYDDRVVATKVDSALFDEYQKVQESLVEARVAKEAEIALEIKIAAAMKKMEEMGAKVFKAQKFIVDDILTMHCPRCKMAFLDWDGCNALYCTCASLSLSRRAAARATHARRRAQTPGAAATSARFVSRTAGAAWRAGRSRLCDPAATTCISTSDRASTRRVSGSATTAEHKRPCGTRCARNASRTA